jgi:hypothetical protein
VNELDKAIKDGWERAYSLGEQKGRLSMLLEVQTFMTMLLERESAKPATETKPCPTT